MHRTDRTLALYLIATAVLVLHFRHNFPASSITAAYYLILAAALLLLNRLPNPLPEPARFLRHFYPLLLIPILYKQVETFAAAFGNWSLTTRIQQAEIELFNGHPSLYLSEMFPSQALSEYLHACYLFYVILLPAAAATFYFRRRPHRFEDLMLTVCLIYCASYLFFSLYPVDSPFYLFPPLSPELAAGPFYQAVQFLSSRGGARGGAFPSLHVSISTAIWLLLWRWERRAALYIAPLILGLLLATVYGRFHYALDVAAGLAVAALAVAVTSRTSRDPTAAQTSDGSRSASS